MAWHIGIDIGGTFTDVAALDLDTGEAQLRKVPSTPPDLAKGAAAGLRALSDLLPLDRIAFFAHGTTAGTNALIEGTGARTGLITTEGFRDLLEIARQQRPSLYDLHARKPQPLVPRDLRREVPERLRFDGSILQPIDLEAVARELSRLKDGGIQSLAICLLHSYANPSHERAVRDLARQLLPGVYITTSSDLLPRFREYERLSTTVVNAYLGPLMDRYLRELQHRTEAAGLPATPYIMQSNGGLASIEEARQRPAATVLSGPAAAAASTAFLCRRLDIERAISMDMGGTSTDLCLIEGQLPASAPGRQVSGYDLDLPGVDVHCIGAGGGSIISADPAGLLQVGPRSAGADPGPACYGRGGADPTLTDALLTLGRIGPTGLLGGEMALHSEAARAALLETVARPLGLTLQEAAAGAIEVAVANIRRAVESLTVARGRDPREFALIAAGGAGPLLACEVAASLDVTDIVIPLSPGSFSAVGLLTSDLRRDWVKTTLMPATPESARALESEFHDLEAEAERWFSQVLPDHGRSTVFRSVAARYRGQDFELPVALPPGATGPSAIAAAVSGFHDAHEGRYGYALRDHLVDIVDSAVTAIGGISPPPTPAAAPKPKSPFPAGRRAVHLDRRGEAADCPVYHRRHLRPGAAIDGPAIIEQYDSTSFLPPRWRAAVEPDGSLRLTPE
ncbi:MAG TPA: hydantoinase/oxoprolinase family protein [Armatimonadota bacterium]|nr:hydantoinase/oxoprolinase family protein [Armatimonadota bacterium]